jgi:hypothetical protein
MVLSEQLQMFLKIQLVVQFLVLVVVYTCSNLVSAAQKAVDSDSRTFNKIPNSRVFSLKQIQSLFFSLFLKQRIVNQTDSFYLPLL